jgi:hypothetical protein
MRVFCLIFVSPLLSPNMMQQPPTPAAPATRPGLARRWWRAANEPLYYDPERSILRQVLWRALLWTPVVLPVVAAALFAGFHFITVWRAHSLAEQAMESARTGALVKARLQAMSASNLLKNDPEVRRAAVFVGSKITKTQEEKNTLSVVIDDDVRLSFMTFPYKLIVEGSLNFPTTVYENDIWDKIKMMNNEK